jgi:hypothetical protein
MKYFQAFTYGMLCYVQQSLSTISHIYGRALR